MAPYLKLIVSLPALLVLASCSGTDNTTKADTISNTNNGRAESVKVFRIAAAANLAGILPTVIEAYQAKAAYNKDGQNIDRQDTDNFPEGGFMKDQALSREETLKGMTIWAAYSNFEEEEKGSIEPGKFADFVILDRDIMEVEIDSVPDTKVISTFVNGEQVYKN